MNRRIVVVMASMALAFVSVAAIAADTKKREAIGYIEAIHGAVFFKADADAPETRLSPKSALAQILRAGDYLRCASGGWVRVWIDGAMEEIRTASWRELESSPNPVPLHVRAVLDEYGRTGGRARGDTESGPVLQWPAEEVGVLPATFVIRWSIAAETCPLELTLQTMERDVIWRSDVDANRVVVDAADLRERLSKHRGSRMALAMSGRCAGKQNVNFEVLSDEEEAQLNDELRVWKSHAADQAILSRLGRASVFAAHRLYAEAASEYDAALREAPESRDLLAGTISAHARAGNIRRMKELQDRLR